MFCWWAVQIPDTSWRPSLDWWTQTGYMWDPFTTACELSLITKYSVLNQLNSFNSEMCALLQVWVIENSMETVARQLLLLYLSLRTPESMSLHSMHFKYDIASAILKLYPIIPPQNKIYIHTHTHTHTSHTFGILQLIINILLECFDLSYCLTLKFWK